MIQLNMFFRIGFGFEVFVNGAVRSILLHIVLPLLLLTISPFARANLVETGSYVNVKCGVGKSVVGTVQLYQGIDDNGSIFTLNCVNNNYFQGQWTHNGKTELFGKCLYLGGLNDWSFFLDDKKNWARIVWWNVDPKTGLRQVDVKEMVGDTPEGFIDRVQKLVMEKKADAALYDTSRTEPKIFPRAFADSPARPVDQWNDQQISVFDDGFIETLIALPPEDTFAAYSESGLPFLQLDPGMLTFPHDTQQGDGMVHVAPEPAVFSLLLVGLFIRHYNRKLFRYCRVKGTDGRARI